MDTEDPRSAYPSRRSRNSSRNRPAPSVELDPPPDHGEQSYKGSGKLARAARR